MILRKLIGGIGMNYKKLFEMLDSEKRSDGASIIDESIVQFGKVETIKAIDYISYFMTTKTFKDMEYWTDYKADANMIKSIKFFADYLANKMNSKTFEYLAK